MREKCARLPLRMSCVDQHAQLRAGSANKFSSGRGGEAIGEHDQPGHNQVHLLRQICMNQLPALSGPELVFGLVGAVGSDLQAVTRTLISELERVRYRVEEFTSVLSSISSIVMPTSAMEVSNLSSSAFEST
jgi:hypothetical protein